MTAFLNTLFGLILVLILGMGAFYGYMGGFSSVSVTRGVLPAQDIIYVTHKGPYENLKDSWTQFQKRWENVGLKECDSLAIYLDPPDTLPENLRSILGCRVDQLPADEQTALKQAFVYFQIPQSVAFQSSFPFRNFLSFFIAPTKVYPKMMEAMTQESLTPSVAIEVYGPVARLEKIRFFMPTELEPAQIQPLYDAFK